MNELPYYLPVQLLTALREADEANLCRRLANEIQSASGG